MGKRERESLSILNVPCPIGQSSFGRRIFWKLRSVKGWASSVIVLLGFGLLLSFNSVLNFGGY